MRASRLFAHTLREAPAEAEAASHQLLLRAAFIRKVVAGVYTTLPLGVRTMRRIEDIVRDEMDGSGAQEIRMPNVLPAEPWKQTGRWQAYGDLMFKLTDRHDREMGLGPTHEEVVTPLVAGELPSYRDLPVNLYQVGWKYRDEFRPRFGLLRGREFLMKDAYSFDRDDDGMRAAYDVMYRAYQRVFDRCGLVYRIVEADPGQIGGGINHEYIAITDAGEDAFLYCETCDYAADLEAATPAGPAADIEGPPEAELETMADLHTPGAPGIADVAALTGQPSSRMLKTMLYDADGRTVAVLLPGDREVNEEKVGRLFFPTTVRLFEPEEFAPRGFVKGYAGPQGMPDDVTIIADHSVRAGSNWITGANREDYHVTGANLDRDFRVDRWEDVIQAAEGDRCPLDGGTLRLGKGIVVGHIYQLGTKYSEPLHATFLDEDGTAQPYVMGCYGIGISRTLAAVAEQYHDDAGLCWPKALAPFEVVVIPTNMDQAAVVERAEVLYAEIVAAGVEAVLDDRPTTAGVKFADADLIGYPVQVVIGKRGVEAGTVDLKMRASGERSQVPFDGAAVAILELLSIAG
ncbi:MAG TPA: proline--tRNA ligase [Actinomycetota bacterium]|nr:proline--tRNA ligase [Actinomycetota bacterium]